MLKLKKLGLSLTNWVFGLKSEQESSNTQTSAQPVENNNDSGKIIDGNLIEGTPFSIIKIDMNGIQKSFLAIGQQRITDFTENRSQLWSRVKQRDWELIMQLCITISEAAIRKAAEKNK